ncbi:hypothetical protein EJ08DRAFT_663915 [Tothia fuscella]|uniref:Uncharacterized protein n=1 Tax=Tothia fuscella TaxID=1048955 RepID=A0A9P4TVL6_9PEZI|nr:hypothetical protein EJ08DRAFT_663915 [Tothia fuscella]
MGGSTSKHIHTVFSHKPRKFRNRYSDAGAEAVAKPVKALVASVKDLVTKNVYSDLTVVCCEEIHPVHRAIVILPDNSEEPHVIASMFTYLYTLHYNDDGECLDFGVPRSHEGIEDSHSVAHSRDVADDERDDGQVGEEESDACSSEFALIPEDKVHTTLKESELTSQQEYVDICPVPPDDLPDLSSQHLGTLVLERDPGYRPCPLHLHAQMHKAGVSCERCLDVHHMDPKGPGLENMQSMLVQAAKRRWASIKQDEAFKMLILSRPEFGKDLPRLL